MALDALLLVLFWPVWTLVPGFGLDESWRTGLTWAHQLGLQWGTDVVFTYGPLYFLDSPLASSRVDVLLAALAWIASGTAVVVTVYAVVATNGRTRPLIQRLAITAGASSLLLVMPITTGLQNLHVLVPAGVLLTVVAATRRVRWLPWIIGVILGLLLLHKVSDAAVVGAMATFCVVAGLGIPGLLRLSAGTGATFLLGWVAAGQAVAHIPSYIATEIQLARGFAPAMATEDPSYVWQYPLAIVLAVGLLFSARQLMWDRTRLCQALFTFGVGLALWVAGREAFTRHDGHYWYFFGFVVVLAVVFVIELSRGHQSHWFPIAVGTAAYLIAATVYIGILAPVERQNSLNSFAQTLGVISSHQKADQLITKARADLSAQYGLTDALSTQIRDRATLADEWDISAVYAAGGKWDPLPVIQNYAAFTPQLDAINGASIGARPRQILRSMPYAAIDGRNPYWDAPSYQLDLYCSFGVTSSTENWQLLAPTGTSRCAERTQATTQVVAPGEPANVPTQPGAITLGTITPIKGIPEEVIDFVTKPAPITVNYGDIDWRLASSPAAVDLMLNAPVDAPAFVGLPPTPFSTITVSHAAELSFAYVAITAGLMSIAVVDGTAQRLPIDVPGEPAAAIVGTHNATATGERDGCLSLVPTGDDPQIVVRAPAGTIIEVQSEQGGNAEAFDSNNTEFTEGASHKFGMAPSVWIRINVATESGYLRFDPPDAGTSVLCRVSGQ